MGTGIPVSNTTKYYYSSHTYTNDIPNIVQDSISNEICLLSIFFSRPSQFKQMAVDSQVQTPDGHAFDVIYVATTKGRILKIVNTADPNGGLAQRPVFIEELMVFSSHMAIDKLKVVRDEVGNRAKLVALAKGKNRSMP